MSDLNKIQRDVWCLQSEMTGKADNKKFSAAIYSLTSKIDYLRADMDKLIKLTIKIEDRFQALEERVMEMSQKIVEEEAKT